MAGVYTDVPGHRFAYDVDGTLIRHKQQDGQMVNMSNPNAINDEDSVDFYEWSGNTGATNNLFTNYGVGPYYLTFIFPQLRDVTAYWIYFGLSANSSNPARGTMQVSTDTTDGSDGTWSTIQSQWAGSSQVNPSMRNAITTFSGGTGVRGIRFGATKDSTVQNNSDWIRLYCVHLYGTLGANNGLKFWHPTTDIDPGGAYFDWGDTAQGTVYLKTFRLKNFSTQQANSVVISAESQSGSPGELASGVQFSLDNSTFANSITVPTIAASSISSVLYVRRTVPGAEAQNLRAARFKAIVGSWT